MLDFVRAVGEYSFLQHAVLAGILASVACGVIGTYVVARRITYIAGGIAHSVLGGMGLAGYLSAVHDWTWMKPLHGAVAAAVVAAVVIGWVTLRAREREDTVIGAIWAIGMAIGVVFIAQTPGYNQELMSYLFGNILMVSQGDLWLMLTLDLLVVAAVVVFYNQFLAVCFDQEFARVRKVHVELYYILLLCLTAITVVIMVTVVGVVMVIALLTLPAAVAGTFTRKLGTTMLLSMLCCALLTTGGLAVSYSPNLPAGATIIILAGILYVLVTAGVRLFRTQRVRIRGGHDARE